MDSQNTTYGDISSDKVYYWPSFAHPSDAIDLAVLPTQSVSSLSSMDKHHQQQNGTPTECYAILKVKIPMDQLVTGNVLKLQIGERVCESETTFYKAMLYPEGSDKSNPIDEMGVANLTPTISPIGDDRSNNGQQQQPSAEIDQQNKSINTKRCGRIGFRMPPISKALSRDCEQNVVFSDNEVPIQHTDTMQFIRNREGGQNLKFGGYTYHRVKTLASGPTYWRCAKSKKKCNGSVETYGTAVEILKAHTHPPESGNDDNGGSRSGAIGINEPAGGSSSCMGFK